MTNECVCRYEKSEAHVATIIKGDPALIRSQKCEGQNFSFPRIEVATLVFFRKMKETSEASMPPPSQPLRHVH